MHRIDQTEGSDRTALSKVDHRDSRRRTEFPFGLNALRLKVGFRALEPSTRELVATLTRVFGDMQSYPELIRPRLLPFC